MAYVVLYTQKQGRNTARGTPLPGYTGMIYDIDGAQRSGKGVFAAAYGTMLTAEFGIPLYATNWIKGANKVRYYEDILNLKNCVFVWDEIDNDLQSRNYQANMEKKGKIIEWLKQAGKSDVILIMVVQYRFQMDKILRKHANVTIVAEKVGQKSKYTFINNDTMRITKKIGPLDMSQFYHLYDHKEFMEELQWREKPSKYRREKLQPALFGQTRS